MDTSDYIRYRLSQIESQLGWSPAVMANAEEWQNRLRERLAACVGGLNTPRIALEPETDAPVQLDGYTREAVIVHSRPGLRLFGYFLLPEKAAAEGALPAVICLPGHGRGVDSIVGIGADGTQRQLDAPAEYQQDFALQCVRQGYAVFALEQISFGWRRDALARAAGPDASSCVRDSMAAQMLGESVTGWRVWDAMRAADYLQTRPEVDAGRIAVMGISGGGLTALFTAALDTRIKAAVVSGYFNTWRDSVLAINHCVDNFMPGLIQLCEMPDLAGLVAPRFLFTESGKEDPIFPLASYTEASQRAQQIYEAFGVGANYGSEVFDAAHVFDGKGAFAFLKANL
jgi:dienelactone hydrolase